MVWFIHLILLCLLYQTKCDCVLDHRTLEEVWEKKLHKDLMNGYKWIEPPSFYNGTDVKIHFAMRTFDFNSDTEIFTMYGVMRLYWTDERLKWDPNEYGGLTESYFYRMEHWIPFIELHNRHDYDYGVYYDQCKVEHTGFVRCSPRVVAEAACAPKMRDWPYDKQTCTLEYKINDRQKNVRLRSSGERAVTMGGAGYGREFTIVEYHQVSNTSDKIQLRMTFVLDRNGDSLAALVIFPAILLSILTTSSFILDVNDWARWLMTLFSMFCHCYFMSALGWMIPKHSENPPTIVLFYQSSLILTMVFITATVFLAKLRNKESAPPSFMSSIYSIVLSSHGKYLVWPRWKTDIDRLSSEDVDVKCVEIWNGFANIVNSVCLFLSIIVYSVMIYVCVPRQQPFT